MASGKEKAAGPGAQAASDKGSRADHATDLSAAAQRQRLLSALRMAPVSTISARRTLAVMHPGARVMELRRAGFAIQTVWSREPDELGILHRQAKYVLQPVGGAQC